MKRTETKTLISACRILARDIQSDDGVANAALAEIADRLEELEKDRERLDWLAITDHWFDKPSIGVWTDVSFRLAIDAAMEETK